MTTNLDQHRGFHAGLEALDTCAKQMQSDPSTYDGEKVRAIIEQFGSLFVRHIHDEIPTLENSKLKAIFTDEDFHRIWNAMINWIIKTNPKLTGLPWVYGCLCYLPGG